VLGLAGRWEAVALVVWAESIARFEELKERPFAVPRRWSLWA
jgi:hypothetical protein